MTSASLLERCKANQSAAFSESALRQSEVLRQHFRRRSLQLDPSGDAARVAVLDRGVRKFHIRHGALVVIAILVEPGDWIRARTTIGRRVVLRDGRRARLRRRFRVKRPARRRSRNDGGDAKLQPTAPVQLQMLTIIVTVQSAEQRKHRQFRFESESISSYSEWSPLPSALLRRTPRTRVGKTASKRQPECSGLNSLSIPGQLIVEAAFLTQH
jgi:hypothetical protein